MLTAARPDLAIVSHAHAPYRLALHRRIAREIPELNLCSVFMCPVGHDPWNRVEPEINAVSLGGGTGERLSTLVSDWRIGGRVVRWLSSRNVRAVVVLGYADAGRLRVIRWCHRHGVPCLLSGDSNIRGDKPAGMRRLAKRIILPRLLRWCSAVLSCGRLGQEYFLRYGVEPDRVFYVPAEPDYGLIKNLAPDFARKVKVRFGLPDGRRRVVFSGRLVGIKRVDLAIHAFAAVANRRPDWDLVILGDGPLRAELHWQVPPHLARRVIWTGFVNDQAVVSAIYRACDVLVLPSESEAWGVVINEAAAAGLAIVASSSVGAAAEIVRDGVNGWIFPTGDLAALTDCLLDVTDPARIDAMKAQSPRLLEQWSHGADPIRGMRRALIACGVLPLTSPCVP